jgi:PhzF family phenazine biosynthesis protein
MDLPFWIVDAFTDRIFAGNPAVVVLPAAFPPDEAMQGIATEYNLSETAFAVPEAEGYRLRWFTPTTEVDLCGHATLATARVLYERGHAGPIHFYTRSGRLTAVQSEGRIVLDFPAKPWSPVKMDVVLVEALGVVPQMVVRSTNLVAVLDSPTQVRNLHPDIGLIRHLPGGAVIVTALGGVGADITSRYFAPGQGIDEDPVTGALHTQVVPFWADRLRKNSLVCHQASKRGGTVWCELVADRVRMAGHSVLFAQGRILRQA